MGVTPRQAVETLSALSAEERRMRQGRAERIRAAVVDLVRDRLPPAARAWLIGSLAWGEFGVRSDVDLVLSGVAEPLATEIEIAVSKSAGAEVDLLTFEHLPEPFRDRVEREGIPIHGDRV